MTNRTAPSPHELEVSIFGRGYGESILIHYGDGQWVLIDSLQEEDKQVSPLNYLAALNLPIHNTAIGRILSGLGHTVHVANVNNHTTRFWN